MKSFCNNELHIFILGRTVSYVLTIKLFQLVILWHFPEDSGSQADNFKIKKGHLKGPKKQESQPVEVERLVFPAEPLLTLLYLHSQITCCLLENKICND